MITLIDQIGVTHHFQTAPKRIISLVPSQTETLFELGLEDKIIGITKFCVHPYHLKATKLSVGGTKKVHIEKIRALNPDIIVANKEENTLEIVEALRDICPVWVTDIRSMEDNFQMISDFGEIFNRRTDAIKWNDKIKFALKEFEQFVATCPTRKAAYLIWREPYMAAGKDTFINTLLELNKFTKRNGSNSFF